MRTIKHHLGPISHVLAGLLPSAWRVGLHRDDPPTLALVVVCAFFALLPDVDSAQSHIGRLLPWLSRPIERRVGHRTATHSLLAVGGVGAVAYLLYPDWGFVAAAYASHVVLDMLVGEEGVPLLWPGPWRFYLADIRPATGGELAITGLLLASCLLPFAWPTAVTTAANVVPKPSPTPTPTPRTTEVVVRVPHVYDPEREVLVEAGDVVTEGQVLADLATYRRMVATPTPTPVPTVGPTPTPAGPNPLEVAQAEAELELARARYRAAVATPEPDLAAVATLAPRATEWARFVEDRKDTLWREREDPDSDAAWRARKELEEHGPEATAVVQRLDRALHPPGPDPLEVAVAEAQLEVARARYRAAVATPTPLPWTTPTPTPRSAPAPGPDETRVRSLVDGRVTEVRIAGVRGNQATVEIVVEVGAGEMEGEVTVARVVDGDTIVVRMDGSQEKVRFIGVDTPETKHPTEPVECYGPEASAFTERLLPPGTSVRLEVGVEEWDEYGRLLAYVWLEDRMVNEVLLSEGYARTMTIPPNVRYAERFRRAQREARAEGRGLWGKCR